MTPEQRLALGTKISDSQRDLRDLCQNKILAFTDFIEDEEKLEVGTLTYLNSVLTPLFFPILLAPKEMREAMAAMLVMDIRKAALNCHSNVTK